MNGIEGESFTEELTRLRIAIAAVDVVLFCVRDDNLQVFLIPVERPPFYENKYGLPGGIIEFTESAEEAAARHLQNKVGIENVHIEQLHTFSEPRRDKRSRAISIAFMALMPFESIAKISDDRGQWVPISDLPELAFDHNEMIGTAIERLKAKLGYTTIVSGLLPQTFTLLDLQNLYEIILHKNLDKRNFRRKVLDLNILKAAGTQRKGTHRPAELYSFKKKGVIQVSIL